MKFKSGFIDYLKCFSLFLKKNYTLLQSTAEEEQN